MYVSEIPMMLPGMALRPSLPLLVFQQQNENQLRQILLGRKLYVRLMTVSDLEEPCNLYPWYYYQAMLVQFKSGFSSACDCVISG